MRRFAVLSLVALAALGFLAYCAKSQAPPGKAGASGTPGTGSAALGPAAIGIDELARLDLLPQLKRSVKVGLVSSYDRSGGNDDGFSGKYSFIRKEPGGLVIADLEGPGAIYRIHTPTPTDDIVEFYFDGESAPRLSLKINELFDGTRAPFLAPLVGSGVGGCTSYLPLTYGRSCKIVIKAETFQFYDINYAVFPADVEVETYVDPPKTEFLARVEKAAALLRRAGTDISDALVPAGTPVSTTAVKARLEPGGKAILYETAKPGRIVGLRLGPAAVFAGGGRDIL
ncbi:MAG: hypothetical protein ACXWHI_06205, partial [Candidatus Aminicenantales bacterium]